MRKALLNKLSHAPIGAWDSNPLPAIAMLTQLQNADRVLVFDTETTGLDATVDEVIQLSVLGYERQNGVFILVESHNWYINPRFAIPEIITKLTGITQAMLVDQPGWEEIAEEVIGVFNRYEVVMGHNVVWFDIPMMNHMYQKVGREFIPNKVIDTLVMARAFLPGYSHKLVDLAELLELEQDENAAFHDSRYDALQTFLLAKSLAEIGQKQIENKIYENAEEENRPVPRIMYHYMFLPELKGFNHENKSINFCIAEKNADGKWKQIRFLALQKQWKSADVNLTKIDMEAFEQQAMQRLQATTRKELAAACK